MRPILVQVVRCCLLSFAILSLLPVGLPRGVLVQGASPSPDPRTRIAVLPFSVSFPHYFGTDLSAVVTTMVEEALFSTEHYRMVDRRALNQAVREQGLGETSLADPATAVRIGRILGVQVLVMGAVDNLALEPLGTYSGISFYRGVARLSARAVDSETSEIRGIASGAGEARGAHPPAAGKKSVSTIALEQAVSGLVAKLDSALQKDK